MQAALFWFNIKLANYKLIDKIGNFGFLLPAELIEGLNIGIERLEKLGLIEDIVKI
jgi:hypothetical protein